MERIWINDDGVVCYIPPAEVSVITVNMGFMVKDRHPVTGETLDYE